MPKLNVKIFFNGVIISFKSGIEVARWEEDEWIEDPTVVVSIANAIKLVYTDPDKLIRICRKHIFEHRQAILDHHLQILGEKNGNTESKP